MHDWRNLTAEDIATRSRVMPLAALVSAAGALRDEGKGAVVSYSPKVFIPLTELCRDVCHYCTYAKTPRRLRSPYLLPEQVLAIAEAGKAQGCREALFTLGDKPELRYRAARDALSGLGFSSTLAYLRTMAERVLRETGLLPHLNPGVLTADDYRTLLFNDHEPSETWMGNPDYHLTTDLADRAIRNITSHTSIYPDQPFFLF